MTERLVIVHTRLSSRHVDWLRERGNRYRMGKKIGFAAALREVVEQAIIREQQESTDR